MARVEKITKKFGSLTVFDNFSAEFPDLKITAVLGASGAGKTTLLNVLAGLEECEGIVEAERPVSYVFQTPRLVEKITVRENLLPVASAAGMSKDESESKIDELLELAEMSDKKNVLACNLSGGQKQRVSIVRAFLFPSRLMLMDEPFSSLDIVLKVKLMDLYARLLKKNSRTVVVVSHDADEAVALADEAIVIKNASECERVFLPEKTGVLRSPADEECVEARKKIYKALGAF